MGSDLVKSFGLNSESVRCAYYHWRHEKTDVQNDVF